MPRKSSPKKPAKPKFGQGRSRVTLTPLLIQAIAELVSFGNTPEIAAASLGLPNTTFVGWMRVGAKADRDWSAGVVLDDTASTYRNLYVAVVQASAFAETRDLETITAASVHDWKAAAWKLQRYAPERWGDSKTVHKTVETSTVVENKVTIESLNLPVEVLREALRKLREGKSGNIPQLPAPSPAPDDWSI